MNLFEISGTMEHLEKLEAKYAAEHEGDVTDFPLAAEFENLAGARDEKLLNIGAWIKSLETEIEAHKAEQKRQGDRARILGNKADRLEGLLTAHLAHGEKLSDIGCALSYRRSERVVVDVAPDDLPKDLAIITVNVAPDKKEIKARLKSDEGCKFAHLEENFNLQIK